MITPKERANRVRLALFEIQSQTVKLLEAGATVTFTLNGPNAPTVEITKTNVERL